MDTVLNITVVRYLELVTLTITGVFLVSKEKPAVSHGFLIPLVDDSQQSHLVASVLYSCCPL